MKFKKGPIRFKGKKNGDSVPRYHTEDEGIPSKFIIHGQPIIKDITSPEIVDIYNEFYIVKYLDSTDNYTQLGFKEDVLENVEFVLPDKWFIQRTPKTADIINKWFVDNGYGEPYADKLTIRIDDDKKNYVSNRNPKEHLIFYPKDTEITFDQFKKYVLKEDVKEPEYLTKDDLVEGEVYCEEWISGSDKKHTAIYKNTNNRGKENCLVVHLKKLNRKLSPTISNSKYKPATKEQKEHLEQCIAAGKYVDYKKTSEEPKELLNKSKEDFKVGDWVVVLPEDKFYDNAEKDKPQLLKEINNFSLPYVLKFQDGHTNSYLKIRKATKEEIDSMNKVEKHEMLKEGRWYSGTLTDSLYFAAKVKDNHITETYGLVNNNWIKSSCYISNSFLELASHETVEATLIEEAKRRGLVNCEFHSATSGTCFKVKEEYRLGDDNIFRSVILGSLMYNGIWATKVEKPEDPDAWWNELKVGDYIVSLISIDNCRNKGDIFTVKKKDNDAIYYRYRTSSRHCEEWRKATESEIEGYKIGINNIYEKSDVDSWINSPITDKGAMNAIISSENLDTGPIWKSLVYDSPGQYNSIRFEEVCSQKFIKDYPSTPKKSKEVELIKITKRF